MNLLKCLLSIVKTPLWELWRVLVRAEELKAGQVSKEAYRAYMESSKEGWASPYSVTTAQRHYLTWLGKCKGKPVPDFDQMNTPEATALIREWGKLPDVKKEE